ncbi:hypothetical protein cgR_2990 [Corynebacterium glutamicum R]|uniref:Uncharacterized protein n=1 Tax=Corynebacterium glutamicum (strain R) TaxID=340322 RepID=A0AB72VER2_CORGB|nr:hypothetical protein cgR_2990 [Corynebacterium glutamicum R]
MANYRKIILFSRG